MFKSSVEIKIDEQEIKKYIHQKLDEQIQENLILVDVKKLAELFSFSRRFLEDQFLNDPRVKQFEVKKRNKRWFWYKKTVEAIKQIISEDW